MCAVAIGEVFPAHAGMISKTENEIVDYRHHKRASARRRGFPANQQLQRDGRLGKGRGFTAPAIPPWRDRGRYARELKLLLENWVSRRERRRVELATPSDLSAAASTRAGLWAQSTWPPTYPHCRLQP